MARIVRQRDICDAGGHNLPLCNVLVGGFPCQDLSIAGKRKGLSGERSGLFFEFVRIASELRPSWLVIENVYGLLTSNQGRDFAIVLLSLENAGYRCAWRVLDSQWFGVAQRRRRVFIVGHADERRAGSVLFEPESGERNPSPVRKTGTDISHSLDTRTGGISGKVDQETIVFNWQSGGSRDFTGCSSIPGALSATQNAAVACTLPASDGGESGGMQPIAYQAIDSDRAGDFTGLPKGMDSRRNKQTGNAMTVPVLEWIGRRIMEAETEARHGEPGVAKYGMD